MSKCQKQNCVEAAVQTTNKTVVMNINIHTRTSIFTSLQEVVTSRWQQLTQIQPIPVNYSNHRNVSANLTNRRSFPQVSSIIAVLRTMSPNSLPSSWF